jgi:hypothetical protein
MKTGIDHEMDAIQSMMAIAQGARALAVQVDTTRQKFVQDSVGSLRLITQNLVRDVDTLKRGVEALVAWLEKNYLPD